MFKQADQTPRPKLKIPSFFSEVFGTVIFVIIVTVLFDLVIPRSLVDGQSMEPTFQHEDRLVISRMNYLLGKPDHGDIVVFNAIVPRDAEMGIMLIKRVIGIPGDTVEIREQEIWLNGEQLDEPYIYEACSIMRCRNGIWQLGEDEYFVMGDNRNHSNDSRSFNAVPYDHIVGRVIFRYWPPNSIGLMTN